LKNHISVHLIPISVVKIPSSIGYECEPGIGTLNSIATAYLITMPSLGITLRF